MSGRGHDVPARSLSPEVRAAIERAATENGIDPAVALAIAERESNFDPQARSSQTIRGMFQMMGKYRDQYGVGDSNDPYTQASGFGKFFNAVKGEMASKLGRTPTDAEGYLGHHFGGVRAGRMIGMDPNTPVDQVFTAQEMQLNPHFGRAGTVGALNASVLADIDKKSQAYGGINNTSDFSESSVPLLGAEPTRMASVDFSSSSVPSNAVAKSDEGSLAAPSAPDFSNFSVPLQ